MGVKHRIPKQYKPAELKAATEVLQNNSYHCFHEGDAHGIVIALYNLGYKIVYTGDPEMTA